MARTWQAVRVDATLIKVQRGAEDPGGVRLTQADCQALMTVVRSLSEEDTPVTGIPASRDEAIAQVDALIAEHVVKPYTEYGIPVFDEFDSPTRTYLRCEKCKQSVEYRDDRECDIVRQLKELRATLEQG